MNEDKNAESGLAGPLFLWDGGRVQDDGLHHFMLSGCLVDEAFPPMPSLEEAGAYCLSFNRGYEHARADAERKIQEMTG